MYRSDTFAMDVSITSMNVASDTVNAISHGFTVTCERSNAGFAMRPPR